MDIQGFGSRRALLKAGAAAMAFATAGGVLAACGPKTDVAATPTADPNPIVTTKYGKVKGAVENEIAVFKGIRYGADTSGANRFMAPKAPEPWTDVKDALAYGNTTPQNVAGDGGGLYASWKPNPAPPQSEDCLFLNVWTPAVDDKKRPVLVWFHGGGFTTGSGSSNVYDGVRIAKRGDVVLVTVNHRLNIFGHLNLAAYGPEFADSSTAGILDMVHSLEWVRDNIAAFGGDPGNVLIFGQSGGGMKTCTLLAMDKVKGLIHRCVVQSGPRLAHPLPAVTGKAADEVVKKLGLTKATIKDIQTKPVEELLAAFKEIPGSGSGPTLDGKNLTHQPSDPDGEAVMPEVPVLIGVTRTEGTSLTPADSPAFNTTWETLPAALKTSFPKKDPKALIDLYKKNYPNVTPVELLFMAQSDARFFQGSVTWADRRASAPGAAPVYFYMLDWNTPVMGGTRFVPHAMDLTFIFDNVAKSASMVGDAPEAQVLADMMSESWIAFAKTGNPANAKLPEWPAYKADAHNMMVFRPTPAVEVDIRAAERKAVTS